MLQGKKATSSKIKFVPRLTAKTIENTNTKNIKTNEHDKN